MHRSPTCVHFEMEDRPFGLGDHQRYPKCLKLRHSMRFRLRSLCVLTALVAVFAACLTGSVRHHRTVSHAEHRALDTTTLDVAGYYEEYCAIPAWLTRFLPSDVVSDYTHVSGLDLTFNELSGYDADEMRQLLPCAYVSTIRIYNPTLSGEMRDALLEFPNLSRIEFMEYHNAVENHACDLRQDPLPGITIVNAWSG